MSTNIERLLILQERDTKILQLEREAKDIPARKTEIESQLNSHQQAYEDAELNLKSKQASVTQIEGDIEGLKEKINKFREQQYQIKDNTAYKALEKEIFTTKKEIRSTEDKELVLMEEMEVLTGIIAEKETALKKEEALVKEDVAHLDKRIAQIESEIQGLEGDRDPLTADIEPMWLSRYERILKHVGDYAIVSIENGSCAGCHMNLPPQVVNDTHKGLDLTFCNFCGRMLYWRP